MMLDERLQMRAADLLLALDGELDSRRKATGDGMHRAHRGDTRDELPLVVRYSAPVDAAIADLGGEGRRLPQVQRLLRLHVVVVVAEQRAPTLLA